MKLPSFLRTFSTLQLALGISVAVHAALITVRFVDPVSFNRVFQDTPLEVITALRPDMIVKGSDYTEDKVVGADVVKSYGGKVVLIDLVEGHSTTRLIGNATAAP